MLPTSGFFKDIDCPYYDNSCGRPYCHFRHRKRNQDTVDDNQDIEMVTTGFPTYKPTPKSQLAHTKSHIPISYVPDTVIRAERSSRMTPMYNYMDKITYKPTPLSELSKHNAVSGVEITNEDLYSISDNKNDDVTDRLELKDSVDCDIDFEELSTEFDMIDDIINECPPVENKEHLEEAKHRTEENKKSENYEYHMNKSSSSSKSSKSSSKSSSSLKDKHDKSKHSRSSSKSHKSSHKSKSDSHKDIQSKEKSKENSSSSDSKNKDEKKQGKERRKSSTSRDRQEPDKKNDEDSNKNRSKDSKSSSKDKVSKSSGSSSKHKEYKVKRKEKHKSSSKDREKHRKESKKNLDKESSKSSEKETKRSLEKEANRNLEKESRSSKKEQKISKEEPKPSEDESVGKKNDKIIRSVEKYESSDNEDDNNFDDDIFNDDLEEECYRIFNEYKPEPVNKPPILEFEKSEVVEEYVPTSKKRVAHFGADQFVSKITHTKQKPAQNAALQMTNRYKIAKEIQNNEENDIVAVLSKHGTKRQQSVILETYNNMKKVKTKCEGSSNAKTYDSMQQSSSLVDDIINGRSAMQVTYKPTPIAKLNASEDVKNKTKRIAPAMNVSSIQQAKAKLAEMTKKRDTLNKTPMQTVVKGNKRVAHIPDTSLGDMPDVLQPDNKKIPVNIRTRYLTMIVDECLKLYMSKEDAYNRAVNEEFKVLERCAAVITYRNSAMLAVNRIRKEMQDREVKGLGPISSDESDVSNSDSQFKGKKFYENILPYVLTEEELEEHGYPRESSIAGKATIKSQKQLPRVNLDENQRLCCRCFKVYLIDDRGFPLYEDECLYHPLKKRTLRGERMYLCCKSTEDTGCVTSNTHVSETEDIELVGYQTTLDPERENDSRNCAVYALDCEMCYTTKGLELTRVTIIDPDCKTVYESLVKPLNPIIDYNTQFSGITKEQMDRTSTSILQVQANILHLCNSKTILIGHSLESDMKALKIIHSCIIDTAIMFPHRLGLPHKRALRVLASEYLKKIIQSDVAGHDSAEDAITCMELVIWKLKEDLKVKGIK